MRITILATQKFPVLELGDGVGRFSLIVFTDYFHFYQLPDDDKTRLLHYCRKHHVGIISFLQLEDDEKNFGPFTAFGNQSVRQMHFPQHSPVRFVGKSTTMLEEEEEDKWTLMRANNLTPSVIAGLNLRDEPMAGAIMLRDADVDHVVLGKGVENWMVKIALMDSLIYMNVINSNLER